MSRMGSSTARSSRTSGTRGGFPITVSSTMILSLVVFGAIDNDAFQGTDTCFEEFIGIVLVLVVGCSSITRVFLGAG